MSDQGALGKRCSLFVKTSGYKLQCINTENIETKHNYTDTDVKTAAAAANAGTCLEDGNSQNNIFSNVGSAVKAVSY